MNVGTSWDRGAWRVLLRLRLPLLLRLGLGGLFVVAGALKLGDPAAFAQQIANYQLVPALAPYLAILLPPVEVVAGLALAAGPARWRQAGALVLALLTAMFTVAVASAAARGLDISCGCFGDPGSASGPVGWLTVARNLTLLVLLTGTMWIGGLPATRAALQSLPDKS
jgi:putative oxidoreductase